MRNLLRRLTSTRVVVGVAAPLAAATLLVAVPAAGARPGQLARPGQPAGAAAGNSAQQRLAAIAGKVDALIGKMTLAEKLGQLEMPGPTGANGTPGADAA